MKKNTINTIKDYMEKDGFTEREAYLMKKVDKMTNEMMDGKVFSEKELEFYDSAIKYLGI